MSLLDLHADELRQAAANDRRQAAPPPARFSAWSAIPRGIAAAAAEVGASASDLVGAAIAYRDTPSKQMERGGLPTAAFSSELGDSVRDYWRSLEPDPQQASTAEQVLFGFARGFAKLIPATLALGPAGAVAAGVEEAMTVSDKLRRQGVQDGARQMAGLIQGTGMASAALPLLGRTLAETAALYVAGGPGGFMAQQALTRKVLENAGQAEIGASFDPFDPVGLSVATALPLFFTAQALRAQRVQAKAKADAEFIAGPRPSEPTPVAAAVAEAVRAPELPREVVDAAMVNHLQVSDATLRQLTNANAGATGLARVIDEASSDPAARARLYSSEVARLRATEAATPDIARHNALMADMLEARAARIAPTRMLTPEGVMGPDGQPLPANPAHAAYREAIARGDEAGALDILELIRKGEGRELSQADRDAVAITATIRPVEFQPPPKATPDPAAEDSAILRRAQELAAENKAIADELAEANRLIDDGGEGLGALDADLVRVAAECALSGR